MKKIKFDKKLSLNKETVSRLNEREMGKLHGGGHFTFFCTTTLITVRCGLTNDGNCA